MKRPGFVSAKCVLLWLLAVISPLALSHGVEGGDAAWLEQTSGMQILPFLYLGAKHMVTGYDHLLFLAGVIFFLYRIRDVAIYVTLFAVGHSATLLIGVLGGIHANAYLVDAIIGLSVVYKGFDNIGGFRRLGLAINTRWAVLLFGLIHGFGLSTKLQDFNLSVEGLVANILAFNVGVELGQFVALVLMLTLFAWWRRWGDAFERHAFTANLCLMIAGFVLMGYQLAGYFTG